MNTQEIILKHVCPGLGCGIALIMFCSPLPAVLRANRARSLVELNALPFAAMCVNCTAWVFYALLLTDWYIYFGNLPGMLLGMFYVLTCYKFSKEAVSVLCGLCPAVEWGGVWCGVVHTASQQQKPWRLPLALHACTCACDGSSSSISGSAACVS